MASKRGLGRGLDALFGDNYLEEEQPVNDIENHLPKKKIEKNVSRETLENNELLQTKEVVQELPIHMLMADPEQPRKLFDENSLMELSNSIRIHGVITPLVVIPKDDRYMIIAGERRYRSCQMAGLSAVPCIIKDYTKKQIREIGLIDNLQRENLNPIETAKAIQELMKQFGYTQEVVAERIGKSRPSIANALRLLTLSPIVRDMVGKNQISSGHARCLVVIDDMHIQQNLAEKCIREQLSVRELEHMVKKYTTPQTTETKQSKDKEQSLELKNLVDRMKKILSTKVTAVGNDNKGRIYIDYFTKDDLDRFLEIIRKLEIKVH